MRVLKNINRPGIPLDFHDPDTNFHYNAHYTSFGQLINNIKAYRVQNGLKEIPDLELLVQEWLCCKPGGSENCKTVEGGRTLSEYSSGAKAFIRTAVESTFKDPFVPKDIANARALTCALCPRNTRAHQNANVLGRITHTLMSMQTRGRTTGYDHLLGDCSVCNCDLQQKVHYSAETVEKSLTPAVKDRLALVTINLKSQPMKCWQLNLKPEEKNGEA